MSGLERQPTDYLIHRETVSRVLSLLEPAEEISLDLDESDRLDSGSLAGLMTRVYRRHQATGLLNRIPFSHATAEQMLGPGTSVPSNGAVLLAFHAGAELDGTTLAELWRMPLDDVGRSLYEARVAVIGSEIGACEQMRSRLGRFADPALSSDETFALVNHSRACQSCSAVLDEFRALDERIADAVAAAPVIQPADRSERRTLIGNPLLLWIPIILIVVAAIAVLGLLGFGTSAQPGTAALFAEQEAMEHRGWLITASEHEVIAFDLESGERRRILEGPAHDWWNPWIISPDAELAVRWEEYTRVEERIGALRAYDMQGERQYLHRWRGPRSRTFSGWLDSRTVLFAERGPTARAGVELEIPDEMAPSLIAADLETGDEDVIFRGPLDKAVPSPNGEYLAIVRPAASPWPAKTVDLFRVSGDEEPERVAQLEHRHLSWPGRMVWADDSETVYFPVIPERDTPDTLPERGDAAPGQYEFERITIAGLGVDGSVAEFENSAEQQWLVPQSIAPDGQTLSLAVNHDLDRDSDWFHGQLDFEHEELSLFEESIPGARWWNSEAVWSPDSDEVLHQEVVSDRFEAGDGDAAVPVSLVLSSVGAELPSLVFQDSTSLQLRRGTGLGLLRWVPDEAMQLTGEEGSGRPNASEPRALSQASTDHQLISESAVASTGRYVLLRQHDPEAGSRDRLMHLQAWGGTQSESANSGDFAWLPREPAVVGVRRPDNDSESGSRLVFVGTDQISPLHEFEIDPAGIGDQENRVYRRPVFSPNGANLAFMVHDMGSGSTELWLDPWERDPFQVTSWELDGDARIDPSMNLTWIADDSLIFTHVTSWDDGYPREIELVRADLHSAADPELTTIYEFSTRGSDRGIDLADLAVGPDQSRIALRLRSFTGSDPDDARDAILVSPVEDLAQSIEIVRTDPGDGMTWLDDDNWLVAGIDGRIALLEATGREAEYLTQGPAAFPVLIGPSEIWYQDLADDGRIMRIAFD